MGLGKADRPLARSASCSSLAPDGTGPNGADFIQAFRRKALLNGVMQNGAARDGVAQNGAIKRFGPAPQQSGRWLGLTEDGKQFRAKLNSNESPFPLPPDVVAAASSAKSHLYTDPGCHVLRQRIGAREGIDPARIVVSPGLEVMIGDIALACRHFAGKLFPPIDAAPQMIVSEHAFYQYEEKGTLHGFDLVRVPQRALLATGPDGRAARNVVVDVDALIRAATQKTQLVFLANPDNPTGGMLPWAEVARLRGGLPPHTLLVLDAAYAEYVTHKDYDQGQSLVALGNTMVLRTFSKAYSMAGDRVGWCYAPPAFVEALNHVRGKYPVTSVSMAHALGMLAHPGIIAERRAHNEMERDRLAARLRHAGFEVWASHTNFLNVGAGDACRATAAHRYLSERGIAVMHLQGYDWPDRLRISIGTAVDCDLVAEALAQFAQDHGSAEPARAAA